MALVNRSSAMNLLSVIVRDGHLTAIGSSSVSLVSALLLNLSIPVAIHIIPFLSCELIYSFNRYKEKRLDGFSKKEEKGLRKKAFFYPFFLIISSILVYCLIQVGSKHLGYFALFVTVMGLLYTILLKNITKSVPGFKNFFVSFCWSLIIFLPLVYSETLIDNIIPAILVASFVFLNTMAFEIILDVRDSDRDKVGHLITFPLVMSKEKVFFLISLLSLISVIPVIFGAVIGFFAMSSLVLLIPSFSVLAFTFIIFKTTSIKKEIYEFLLDSVRISWSLLLVMSIS